MVVKLLKHMHADSHTDLLSLRWVGIGEGGVVAGKGCGDFMLKGNTCIIILQVYALYMH